VSVLTDHHPLLIYRSNTILHKKLIDFFKIGIDSSERCIFITSQNDGDFIFKELKKNNEPSSVVKLFSYFSVPDPEKSPVEFEKKWSKLVDLILNENFRGRVAFNVLCDISRFTSELISKIDAVEKYIHSISNEHSKFLCTYKIGEVNNSLNDMLDIGFSIHDHISNENEDGSYSEILK